MRTLRYSVCSSALVLFALQAGAQTVTCSSDDGKRHYCRADTGNGIDLVRQRSGSACQRDYSWGYDDQGVWVDHGCRADFAPAARSDRSSRSGSTITCSSDDGSRHYCDTATRGRVRLVRQISDSPCRRGESWDADDRGLWVDRGCRAEFAVETGRWDRDGRDGDRRDGDRSGSGQIVSCSSDDGRRHHCDADTRRGVDLVKQRSDSPCTMDSSWGYDSSGIWVDRGCRADFQVR